MLRLGASVAAAREAVAASSAGGGVQRSGGGGSLVPVPVLQRALLARLGVALTPRELRALSDRYGGVDGRVDVPLLFRDL